MIISRGGNVPLWYAVSFLFGILCPRTQSSGGEGYLNNRIDSSECKLRCSHLASKLYVQTAQRQCDRDCQEDICLMGCTGYLKTSSCSSVCGNSDYNLGTDSRSLCDVGCNQGRNIFWETEKNMFETIEGRLDLTALRLTSNSVQLLWKVELNASLSFQTRQDGSEESPWVFVRSNKIFPNSTAVIYRLKPFTAYKFRMVYSIPHSNNVIVLSKETDFIQTAAQGRPSSKPKVNGISIDASTIFVSWEKGPLTNGPLTSYNVNIKSGSFSLQKTLPFNKSFCIFENLDPSTNYSIQIGMSNSEGAGRAAEIYVATKPRLTNEFELNGDVIVANGHEVNSYKFSNVSEETQIFTNKKKIVGMSLHVRYQWLYVVDESGYVFRVKLNEVVTSESIIQPNAMSAFKIHDVEVDWLNDNLYMTLQTTTNEWKLARCDLDGRTLEISSVLIASRPEDIKVDPINGYLYWRINDRRLYQLGMFEFLTAREGRNIIQQVGPFSADSQRFKIWFVRERFSLQNVDLDLISGDGIQAFNATSEVKWLTTMGHYLFWTDDNFLYNFDGRNETVTMLLNIPPPYQRHLITINMPHMQPSPQPASSPGKLQVLFSFSKANLTWDAPKHLPFQDPAAFNEWSYDLEMTHAYKIDIYSDIKSNHFTVENLQAETYYKFRVRAAYGYSKGPWSESFAGNTSRQDGEMSLIWADSTNTIYKSEKAAFVYEQVAKVNITGRILQSEMLGEEVIIFLINSTLYKYEIEQDNFTSIRDGVLGRFEIDSFGRKIYFLQAETEVLCRVDMDGNDLELLPAYFVKDFQIDSHNGYVYFSSGHDLRACRLNGRDCSIYFESSSYVFQEILHLAIDYERNLLLWTFRESSEVYMYRANLMPSFDKSSLDRIEIEKGLWQNRFFKGHVNFIWFDGNNRAFSTDLLGDNIARIPSPHLSCKLVGIKVPKVGLDNSIDASPIPEPVTNSTIHIQGTWDAFNISWHGSPAPLDGISIFYEIFVRSGQGSDFQETSHTSITLKIELPPYSLIHVYIRAFTYWGYSRETYVELYTPPAQLSEPLNPRLYVTHKRNNITADFRWSSPLKLSSPIAGYKVSYYEQNAKATSTKTTGKKENRFVLFPLLENTTYFIEAQAFTEDNAVGKRMPPIKFNTAFENPVPRVLFTNENNIIEMDLDRNASYVLYSTTKHVLHLNQISDEGLLIWIEDTELNSFNGTMKRTLAKVGGNVLSLTVDWLKRKVYWSEGLLENNASKIYSLDLMKTNALPETPASVSGIAKNLEINPFKNILYWLQFDDANSTKGTLYKMDNGSIEEMVFSSVPAKHFKAMSLLNLGKGDAKMLLVPSEFEKLFKCSLKSGTCKSIDIENRDLDAIYAGNQYFCVKSKNLLSLYDLKFQNLKYNVHLNASTDPIFAFPVQDYPPKQCLEVHAANNSQIELLNKTFDSLAIKFPSFDVAENCSIRIPGIEYTYKLYENENEVLLIDNVSYEPKIVLTSLNPYTNYIIEVFVTNFYRNKSELKAIRIPKAVFATSPGIPSPPRNIVAEAKTPTDAELRWEEPAVFNNNYVWYAINWETQNQYSGDVVRYQQRFVGNDTKFTVLLSSLQPRTKYRMWIEAFTTNSTFSTSESVILKTFSNPEDISTLNITSNSALISWVPPRNIANFTIEFNETETGTYQLIDNQILLENLKAKTTYPLRIKIFYPNWTVPFIWPQHSTFNIETLPDCPSAPGVPIIEYISSSIYKVHWEPAVDNGAPIEQYHLEALEQYQKKRDRRSVIFSKSLIPPELNWADEPVPLEDKWYVFCNNTDPYCIVMDLYDLRILYFRVIAKNALGWGAYSDNSKSINESYLTADKRESLLIAIFLPATTVAALVLLAMCVIFVAKRRNLIKGHVEMQKINKHFPRWPSFIQPVNSVRYSLSQLTDSDVALLPQVQRHQIRTTTFLGSGAFGDVYEGVITTDEHKNLPVAIKALRKGTNRQQKSEFLQEAQLMSNFKHKNVLTLIGVCFDTESPYIIMELMKDGDLLNYLRNSRANQALNLSDLLSICVDIATGCKYLGEMHFVHRDLACRNCLVSTDGKGERSVKIGDFGLARDVYNNDYYRKKGDGLLPVRWMAPESLLDGVFTSQSDIWSFGVLCWEIVTLGEQPYPGKSNYEVLNFVKNGGLLDMPEGCPQKIYDTLLTFWNYDPKQRPSFSAALADFEALKEYFDNEVNVEPILPETHLIPHELVKPFAISEAIPTSDIEMEITIPLSRLNRSKSLRIQCQGKEGSQVPQRVRTSFHSLLQEKND